MAQLFNIVDDTVIIDKLALKYTQGSVIHAGSMHIASNVLIDTNLVVNGTISAEVINVKNLVTDNGALAAAGIWTYSTEDELNGKGFFWNWNGGHAQLIYRNGGRLWTNVNFDVDSNASYNIGNIPVLTANSLGDSIINSKLRSVGTLASLNVSGSTSLGEFLFVDADSNRIGIGTDEPTASLTILDNNVEIGIGSPDINLANIGTYSNHDLEIVTDGIPRIAVKAGGEVNVTGNLNVAGTLYAANLVTESTNFGDLIQTNADKVSINNLGLRYTFGSVVHSGSFNILGGSISTDGSLTVGGQGNFGTINVDILNVKQIVAAGDFQLPEIGKWSGESESDLIDQGFEWTYSNASTYLVYQAGGVITTNGIVNASAFSVDGFPVLNSTTLGESVVHSNLTSVGQLESLTVAGTTVLAGFAAFNGTNVKLIDSDHSIGINLGTDMAQARVGTYTLHDFSVIAGGNTVATFSANGELVVGTPGTSNAVLRVLGTVIADSIQTDTAAPISFSNPTGSVYGLGLQWTSEGNTEQFVLRSDPNRLWSSVGFDVDEGQGYYVNGQWVLNSNSLGDVITNSKLTTVGALVSLTVLGNTALESNLTVAGSITVDDIVATSVATTAITTDSNITVSTSSDQIAYGDASQINIGDKTKQTKPVKVFGPLSVNVNNPDPTLQFTVNGDVSIGGKRFMNSDHSPTMGTYNVGDITWNTRPNAGGFVGWICTVTGTPGIWIPFGMIANQ